VSLSLPFSLALLFGTRALKKKRLLCLDKSPPNAMGLCSGGVLSVPPCFSSRHLFEYYTTKKRILTHITKNPCPSFLSVTFPHFEIFDDDCEGRVRRRRSFFGSHAPCSYGTSRARRAITPPSFSLCPRRRRKKTKTGTTSGNKKKEEFHFLLFLFAFFISSNFINIAVSRISASPRLFRFLHTVFYVAIRYIYDIKQQY
jgi:hypothetical protein